MIILSIDVGMKNLVYCLFQTIENDYKILKWDIITIMKNIFVKVLTK